MANQVVGFVFYQVEIEVNDLAHGAPKSLHICSLPTTEMLHFVVGQILLLILGRIVYTVFEVFPQERRELAAPHLSAIGSELNGTTKINEHGWGEPRQGQLLRPREATSPSVPRL